MTTTNFPGAEVFQQWIQTTTDPMQLQQRMKELQVIKYWLAHNQSIIDSTIAALDLQMKTAELIKENPLLKAFDPMQAFLNPLKFWSDTFEQATGSKKK